MVNNQRRYNKLRVLQVIVVIGSLIFPVSIAANGDIEAKVASTVETNTQLQSVKRQTTVSLRLKANGNAAIGEEEIN